MLNLHVKIDQNHYFHRKHKYLIRHMGWLKDRGGTDCPNNSIEIYSSTEQKCHENLTNLQKRRLKKLQNGGRAREKLAKLFLKAGGGAARPQRLRGGGRPPFGARARARARARAKYPGISSKLAFFVL